MPAQSYHGAPGRDEFLGLRHARSGATEIVYDGGAARRMIWRIAAGVSDSAIGEVIRMAAGQRRVVPAVYAELNRRSIQIEDVIGDPGLV